MSEKIEILGGVPLRGRAPISGAKNSVLPILAATVMTGGRSEILNCPELSDVRASMRILRCLGCEAEYRDCAVTVRSDGLCGAQIPAELMREMRSSIIFLGAILARFGEARLCAPGGCDIGLRPIDLHLAAFREMGVHIDECGGVIRCKCPNGIRGADISLSFPSVGATENVMLAACAAKGRTRGAGSAEIVIDGGARLSGCRHRVIPDRIAAGSFLAAGAITGGSVTAVGARAEHLRTVLPVFRAAGCEVSETSDGLRLDAPERLKAVNYIRTMPYPGFPTDLQAVVTACMCVADGVSIVRETIFENRYKHVPDLVRLGADIRLEDGVAVIRGARRLTGAQVTAADLRGGFALLLAGLAAEGKTTVFGVEHIDRGYENVCENLRRLGARIRRSRENGDGI